MHVVFDEFNVLLKKCNDCAEHPIERDASSNEEKEEEITKPEELGHDLPKEIRAKRTIQKIKSLVFY